jgi:hypothetical protein
MMRATGNAGSFFMAAGAFVKNHRGGENILGKRKNHHAHHHESNDAAKTERHALVL